MKIGPVRIAVLYLLFVIALVGLSCLISTKGAPEVSIGEVVSDRLGEGEHEGNRILVSGIYRKQEFPRPMCVPTGTGEDPEITENYKVFPSRWMIVGDGKMLGVMVLDGAIQVSTLPQYEEGQSISLEGVVRYATVVRPCNKDIHDKSVYIEVDIKDVDIPDKKKGFGNPGAF